MTDEGEDIQVAQKIVDSKAYPLKDLFSDKFDVDFYQRQYVWESKQLEDLISDLSSEFLKNWRNGDGIDSVRNYDPYFMGEIVLSLQEGKRSSVIDGQQRITSFTLLLIYMLHTYGHLPGFPKSDIEKLIYSDDYGTKRFNLEIAERKECMLALFNNGEYTVKDSDSASVQNIVDRYNEFAGFWNERITDEKAVSFIYWIKEKVIFSKVWTNSDDFAYIIFETMNDRGLPLTQVEMLRSYLLANIKPEDRARSMKELDEIIKLLTGIKLNSKSKAEFEFFKMYFRGHLAEDLSQGKNTQSDFVQIGKGFHRWVRDKSRDLGLRTSQDFSAFISQIAYFARVYARINDLILSRNTRDYLYLIVNSDYGFTLQPALILASIKSGDNEATVNEKIKVVSKYLTKVLTWRVWNHWIISQSSLEAPIYDLCKSIRDMDLTELKQKFSEDPLNPPALNNVPSLNQQNRQKIKVLLSLITEIVAANSGTPDYMLNKKDIEVEHIWANHFEQHRDEFDSEQEFAGVRNSLGDLLVLPKSFNSSYGDAPYEEKVVQYFEQNILAQSLNENKYHNNPGFIMFIESSGLPFKSYQTFTRTSINERADLYRKILYWNWP